MASIQALGRDESEWLNQHARLLTSELKQLIDMTERLQTMTAQLQAPVTNWIDPAQADSQQSA